MTEPYLMIVFVRSHTLLGRMARMGKKYPYTHVAVSLDGTLKDLATFSRRRQDNPFDCGFMRESLAHYAYGKHSGVKLKIYRLPVTAQRMEIIRDYVQRVEEDSTYRFNLFSMATQSFLHGLPISKTHNCMSFTGRILKLSETVPMDRPYYAYDLKQLDELLLRAGFVPEEGYFAKGSSVTPVSYMKRTPLIIRMADGLRLCGTLLFRMARFYR